MFFPSVTNYFLCIYRKILEFFCLQYAWEAGTQINAADRPVCGRPIRHDFLKMCEQGFFWQARFGQLGVEICIGMITE
ncbi:hypothetical protein S101447_00394 [Acetobacter ascendens]|uniref:Uncharacterized protein n=1 Tax=Acetobacter ascendens TaxID=481146 RepID=A0A1Y0V0S1_9PROT|nr:hypothetical protein S101447_00394 [Acetobacter ascendens]